VRRVLLALGLACLGAGTGRPAAAGLEPEFTVRQWHTQDGLPNEEITQIAEDDRGYLWVATNGGLARFDGRLFRAARLPAREIHAGNVVNRMARVPVLGLVVAFARSGVRVERDGEFVADARFAAVGDRTVIALFGEADGTVWLACEEGIVFRCTPASTQQFNVPRSLPGARRIGFATDGLGRLWVASDMTLLLYQEGRLEPFGQDFGGEELRIASSRDAGPWLITERQLLRLADGRFVAQLSLPPLFGAHYVQASIEDRAGGLWIATRSKGLLRLVAGQLVALPRLGEDIYELTEDSRGTLWAGTNGAGLGRLQRRTYQLFNRESGLAVDYSSSVCADDAGRLWFANRDGGVVEWDGREFFTHRPLPDWPAYSAVTVFPLTDGRLGFTCGSGAYVIRGRDQPITKLAAVPPVPTIRRVFTTRSGETWTSLGPDQLARLDGPEFSVPPGARLPAGQEIRALGEDEAGRLLVGTGNGELLRLVDNRLTPFAPAPPGEGGAIQCILTDRAGRIWLGTESGLLAIDGNGRWVLLDRSHGLTHQNITQIIDDGDHLWFGSGGGIFGVSRQSLEDCAAGRVPRVHAVVLAEDESGRPLTCVALFQPAAWKTAEGRLWFATRRGVVAFDPRRELTALPPPRVAIEAARADGRDQAVGTALRVSARLHRLELDFSALSLEAPDRIRVRYRLDGFDNDWIEAGPSRTAQYPALPPGDYRFQVSASQPDQPETGLAGLAVTVLPLWWQTPLFRAIAALAAVGLIVLAARQWSNHRLRRKLERIERESALERERARIAHDIHDDLGASLTRISLLTQSAPPEETASPGRLGQIYETVSQITRSMDEIVWAVDPQHDNLEALAGYLASYAQNFLAPAGIRCRLDLPTTLPLLAVTSQTRHHLFLCLKEALNNIVRHAQATEVTLALAVEEAGFLLRITDNGRGCPTDRPGATTADRTNPGNGLKNMRERMASIGGRWSIDMSPTGGTMVTFFAPRICPKNPA